MTSQQERGTRWSSRATSPGFRNRKSRGTGGTDRRLTVTPLLGAEVRKT